MAEKKLFPKDYLLMPYSRVLIPDKESGTYTAQILEFPGCITEGRTPEEAYARLEDVAESWLEAALEMGHQIPKPSANQEYGGKIALRLPKSLHRQVAHAAERDGTSINQFIMMALSEKAGVSEYHNRLAEEISHRLVSEMGNQSGSYQFRQAVTVREDGKEK